MYDGKHENLCFSINCEKSQPWEWGGGSPVNSPWVLSIMQSFVGVSSKSPHCWIPLPVSALWLGGKPLILRQSSRFDVTAVSESTWKMFSCVFSNTTLTVDHAHASWGRLHAMHATQNSLQKFKWPKYSVYFLIFFFFYVKTFYGFNNE